MDCRSNLIYNFCRWKVCRQPICNNIIFTTPLPEEPDYYGTLIIASAVEDRRETLHDLSSSLSQ